ncbi:1,4-alpha-glucan branching protein GlgB [Austwickia chelonae]|uniref:1,4-alpha-glucan branching protein GlgB n=1 Tax=Austwickia chelonae TaxID=100225 RepID=UPI000E254EF9|nr:1,4-alpha-glucan branching protein GlgB [Austwickia chelonae]
MAEIHHDAVITPSKLDLLAAWLPTQRWYAAKGIVPRLRRVGGFRFEDPVGQVGMETLIVVDESATPPVVYQVPVTYRDAPLADGADALIGVCEHSVLGTRYVYDAPKDPAYVTALVSLITRGGTADRGHAGPGLDEAAQGAPQPGAAQVEVTGSRVLTGEQSNTSVICDTRIVDVPDHDRVGAPCPLIVKIFRVLQDGENPDVVLQSALAGAGSRSVPMPFGSMSGRWSGVDRTDSVAEGHLAFAQEFFPGTRDAWRVAVEAAASGTDFTERAFALGVATAAVHLDLAAAMPVEAASRAARQGQLRSWQERCDLALSTVPDLAVHRATINEVFTAAAYSAWPRLQRVHGDYHLGQVLEVPGRGWVLLDFEGEPLRPLIERNRADLPLRDVAGMLRSFDYVAGSAGQEDPDSAVRLESWATACRRSFLDGYASCADDPRENADSTALLRALELDKALYEVVYEARHRPPWLSIPAGAVARLCSPTPSTEQEEMTTDPDQPQQPEDRTDQKSSPVEIPAEESAAAPTPMPEINPILQRILAGEKITPENTAALFEQLRQPAATVSEPVGPEAPEGMVPPAASVEPVAPVEPEASPDVEENNVEESHEKAFFPSPFGVLLHRSPAGEPPSPEPLSPFAEESAPADVPDDLPSTESTAGPEDVVVDPVVPGDALPPPDPEEDAEPFPAAEDQASDETVRMTSPETDVEEPEVSAEPAEVMAPMAEEEAAPLAPAPATAPVDEDELTLLVNGGHGNPHGVLGAHPWNGGVTVRALRPGASSVDIELPDGSRRPMAHQTGGIWQVQLDIPQTDDYRLIVDYGDGFGHRQDDPYRFLPTVGELDLHLIGEGRHEELWKVLGSQIRTYSGPMGEVTGTSFAVWAPNARAIRVVGDFNTWDGTAHPMRALGSTGVWELFVPGVGEGTVYKYEILGADGYRRTKADPLARATECPPATASVVTASRYEWNDAEWMQRRAEAGEAHLQPMSVYEVHLGSWRQGLSYTRLAEELVEYVSEMGFTHVELMPVMEHPYGPSWGYQVSGYYAPSSRFGDPDEFRYLVDRLHQAGIGVILDWVPAHFPKDGFALGRFDGQALYEHPDPRRGEHTEWGTYIFDFGRPQVRNFLVANAVYWLEEFHADGLRVDAVASMLYLDYSRDEGEWLPNQFGGRENLEAVQLLQETNATVYRRCPGAVTIAEESTSWSGVTSPTYMGGLGFGLKWNMGWMHDTLGYAQLAPIYRQYHHHEMTFAMVYAYNENFALPISHDEVVHGKGSMLGKMPGSPWEQLSNLRAYYAWQWSFPGKQLLFMGSEFAQIAEWADGRSLDWWLLDQEPHEQTRRLVRDLNRLYVDHPALWQLDSSPEGFAWIDANDSYGNAYSFLRFGAQNAAGERPVVACVANFSGVEHHSYRIGLPHGGMWREILNTDAGEYGGAGIGNMGQIEAEEIPWHGQPYSATVSMQKLSAVWFEPAGLPSEVVIPEAVHPAAEERPTLGTPRPELSNSPVQADVAVDSGLGSLPPVHGGEIPPGDGNR